MSLMKSLPISLLKTISDKNYESGRPCHTIDFDAMLKEFPNLETLELLGIINHREHGYEAHFKSPVGGMMWLRLGLTKGQLKKVQSSIGI